MNRLVLEPSTPARTPGPDDPSTRLGTTRSAAIGAAAALVVVAAVLSGWLTPRGPLTTTEALVSLVVAVAIGTVIGLLTASRWAFLGAPLLYVAVFEVVRLGAAGPTVDGIQLTSTIGAMVFVVGRVAHGVLVLLPLVAGVGWGLWLAHRRGHTDAHAPGWPARIALGLLSLAVVALAVGLARPVTTPPIAGPDGSPLAGSIAELATVEIGGVDQVVMLRGRSTDNPVLLHLAGGPGGTDIGAMRADTSLEQDFVVATWDQRGTGKSYATSIDPVEDLTLEQAVADTLAVTDWLRNRFGEDRIYLTANSWGTIPSTLAVQQHPERYHAYIGTGQMVNNRLTDQMFFEDALAWAQDTGRDDLAATMRSVGPPPYADLTDYQVTVGYEHQWNDYPGVEDLDEMPFNTFVPENSLMDRINAVRGMADVNWFVYPQLQTHDFRTDVPSLDVPVWIVLGEHEARGRDVLAREWFDGLDAPTKELVVVEGAGHRPSFEDPAGFAELLRQVVTEVAAPG